MIEKIEEKSYREIPQISQSSLKDVLTLSCKEFYYKQKHGVKETDAMFKGTEIHRIALEGHEVTTEDYVLDKWLTITGKGRRGGLSLKAKQYFELFGVKLKNEKEEKHATPQAYRTHLEEIRKNKIEAIGKKPEDHPDLYPIVKHEDLADIEGTAKAIEDRYGRFLAKGTPEIAIHSVELEGVMCKGLLDFLPDKGYIFDLKTTATPLNDREIKKHLNNDFWKIQAAFYHDLLLAETGESRPFAFFVVQTKPPYSTRTVVIQPEDMLNGREAYIKALEIYKEWETLKPEERHDWPKFDTNDKTNIFWENF